MITEDEFNFLSKNNCYYCGKPGPNGIDRVDNSKGYVTGNCVPCCKHCNYVKGALSVTDFKTWTERFVNHQNKHKTIQLLMNIIYKLIK